MSFLSFLASIRNPFLDYLMLGISHLGTPFFIFGVIGWYYLNVNKKEAYGMGLAFCYSCLLCQGIKILARVPRPWNLDTSFEPVAGAVSSAGGYSFPSIHTQSVTSFCLSGIYFNKKRKARIILAVLLVLVAFSRMYLGCHTPMDVAGAFVITSAVTAAIWHAWNRHRRTFAEDNMMLVLFLLGFAAILLALAGALNGNGTIDYSNAKDSFETAGLAIGFVISCFVESRLIRFSEEGTLPQKVLRFLIALAGIAVIQTVLKRLGGSNIPLLVIRYMLLILWLMVATPLISIKAGLASRIGATRMPKI